MVVQDDGATAAESSGSAVETVVAGIRQLIRERRLGVSDVLPSEAELGGMFGAGRNTVREAIRTLKAYGVVESRQKVGAVIIDRRQDAMTDLLSFAVEISADTFNDIQGFRRLTEMNLGEALIERITGVQLDAAEGLNAAMEAATEVGAASALDFRFHQLLVDAAGNRTLSEIYAMLRPVICRLMETGKSRRAALHAVATEHADILDALRRRDRIAYGFHMHRHLQAGLRYIAPVPDARSEKRRDGR